MKRPMTATLVVFLAGAAHANDKHALEKRMLLQMDSSSCGYTEKDGKTLAGQVYGTDGQHKNTKEVLCQEYILKSDRVIYRIRCRNIAPSGNLKLGLYEWLDSVFSGQSQADQSASVF